MAYASAVSMAMPMTNGIHKGFNPLPVTTPFKKIGAIKPSGRRVAVKASLKDKAEKVATGLTAAALTASMVVPDVAEAAVSPSLKNFLLSIVAGGVVVGAIIGAVIGVSNFDPVKRS